MTRTHLKGAAVAAIVLILCSPVLAQGWGGNAGPLGMLGRYDTDGDGKVSAAEFSAGRMKFFGRLDANGDQTISAAELNQAQADMQSRGGPMQAMMQKRIDALKAADANADGAVSADEYTAAVTAEFTAMDTNGDGFIDAGEVAAKQ